MALSTNNARAAIIELLDGTLPSDFVDAGLFAHGVFDGQPPQAQKAMAVQTAIATHRFDVQFTANSDHSSAVSRIGDKRLVTLGVTIPVWTHVATTAQETDRNAVLADIGADMAAAMRGLGYPHALAETDAGADTGIVAGMLHGPNGDGFPRWRVTSADWNQQLIKSEITGSIIFDATVTTLPDPEDIDAAPLSVGATSATWTGWSTPALTVFSSGGVLHLRDTANDGRIIAMTQRRARDARVTFYGNRAIVYARLNAAGRGYFADINALSGGTILIGVADGVTDSNAGTYYTRAQATNTAWIPGYTVNGATDEWVFSVQGYTVSLSYNGTTLLTFNDIYLAHETGRVAVRSLAGAPTRGFARVSVDFTQATLYSDSYIDVRDLGVKASAMDLTGSIAQGSTTLTLSTASHNIAVGDWVIVEPSESRNNDGVGGVWPSTGYADAATIQALPDPGPAAFCVYDESNGDVWVWGDSTQEWSIMADALQFPYYFEKKIPKPLIAYVLDVDGATITLDTAASKTATNVRVFVDAFGPFYAPSAAMAAAEKFEGLRRTLFNPLLAPQVGGTANFNATDCSAIAPENLRVHFPAGYYASWRGPLFVWGWQGMRITGAGSTQTVFYAPNWTGDAGLCYSSSDDGEVSGIGARGGYRLDGYGWGKQLITVLETGVSNDPDVVPVGFSPACFCAEQSRRFSATDIASEEGWRDVIFAGSHDSSANVALIRHTDPSKRYNAWHVNISESARSIIRVGYFNSDHLIDGHEQHSSEDCEIIVEQMRNAQSVFNSSKRCTLQILDGVIEEGASEGTFSRISGANRATIISMTDQFQHNDCHGNKVLNTNLRVLDTSFELWAVSAGHDYLGAELKNSRIENAQTEQYCFISDDSGGESEWFIDNCEFVGGIVRMEGSGSISNSSGPRLERESDVTESNNSFDVTVVI